MKHEEKRRMILLSMFSFFEHIFNTFHNIKPEYISIYMARSVFGYIEVFFVSIIPQLVSICYMGAVIIARYPKQHRVLDNGKSVHIRAI